MKKILARTVIMAVTAAGIIWAVPSKTVEIQPVAQAAVAAPKSQQQHRLETYLSALEWCESGGLSTALNAKDKDGTPSYSNYQWKPGTLLAYAKQYGLIPLSDTLAQVPELLKDYDLQRTTVADMSQDPHVNWAQQFPGCTKKLGYPPKLSTTTIDNA